MTPETTRLLWRRYRRYRNIQSASFHIL